VPFLFSQDEGMKIVYPQSSRIRFGIWQKERLNDESDHYGKSV
jgi:hypothetical protein